MHDFPYPTPSQRHEAESRCLSSVKLVQVHFKFGAGGAGHDLWAGVGGSSLQVMVFQDFYQGQVDMSPSCLEHSTIYCVVLIAACADF